MVSARDVAGAVVDPELRVVSIAELGILRDVVEESDGVRVTVTPTYAGCPALDTIREDISRALADAGYPGARVETVLRPAWSTDLITESGRAKLARAGIAPPTPVGAGPVPLRLSVACPRCGSPRTEQLSRFGSTACKAMWRCTACGEPFEHVKPL